MRNRRGFTLVEILVVIGIILVLAGIVLPMLVKAYSQADKTKTMADLNTIAVALEAYRQDMGDFPRCDYTDTTSGERGARVLAWALLAPQPAAKDGADGLGFRVRAGMGRVCGPYLQADRLKPSATDATAKLMNKDGYAILYYPPCPVKLDPSIGTNFVGATNASANTQIFNANDNSAMMSTNALRVMLGDYNYNGRIETGLSIVSTNSAPPPATITSTVNERALASQGFLLVSPGADGAYGPTVTTSGQTGDIWTQNKLAANTCDDVFYPPLAK